MGQMDKAGAEILSHTGCAGIPENVVNSSEDCNHDSDIKEDIKKSDFAQASLVSLDDSNICSNKDIEETLLADMKTESSGSEKLFEVDFSPSSPTSNGCSSIVFENDSLINFLNASETSEVFENKNSVMDGDIIGWTNDISECSGEEVIDLITEVIDNPYLPSPSSSTCSTPTSASKPSLSNSIDSNLENPVVNNTNFISKNNNMIQYKSELSDSNISNLIDTDGCSDQVKSVASNLNMDLKGNHDCISHPKHTMLVKELEELKSLLDKSQEKNVRLEGELIQFESLQGKLYLLEQTMVKKDKEIEGAKKKHDSDAKLINSLQTEMTSKLASMNKQVEQAVKDKESMVMKYVRSEKEVMDFQKDKEVLTKKLKETVKENESLLSKLKVLTSEKSKISTLLDSKTSEIATSHKEIDKLKEDLNSRDIKIKWIQNKVKSEMDLHKECPEKINRLTDRIGELQKQLEGKMEELETCKKHIQDYEATKALEGQLKEEQAKIILERHEHSEKEAKLKSVQAKNETLIEENNNLSFQVQNLEVERFELEEKMSLARAEIQEKGNSIADLKSRLVEFDSISNQLFQEREKVDKIVKEVERLRKTNEELMNDMANCRSREAEMLSFTQKLTTKNVQLQSEFSSVEAKVSEVCRLLEKSEEAASKLGKELNCCKEDLKAEKLRREDENRLLARGIAEKTAKIDSLEAQLADARTQISGLKHKHQSALKELQRELQQCHKKVEQYEHQNTDGGSNIKGNQSNSVSSPPSNDLNVRISPDKSSNNSSLTSIPESLLVDVSPASLVERILKLQAEVGRYQEKVEFLEEHNASLVEQLKKKGRLLHSYILREQSGVLASNASDAHKAEVSKHGGIMSSVYGSRTTDDAMTLELSLEINHKQQAILEDTLLKNITLKENIDTLGDEIFRLKQQLATDPKYSKKS